MRKILALAALLAFAGSADAATFPFKGTDGNTYTGYASGPLATFSVGQAKVSTSVQTMAALALTNGITISCKSNNAGAIFFGGALVNTTYDGTGTGFACAPGQTFVLPITNNSVVNYVGTAGDVFTWEAN